MKLRMAVWQQNDFELAFLMLHKLRACYLSQLMRCGVVVLHFDGSLAAHLKAIVVTGACSEVIDTEAGAGIVNLQQVKRCASLVLHRCLDVVRTASANKRSQH